MAIVVPAVLGGLAIAVMALVSSYAARKRQKGAHLRAPSQMHATILVHSINDDRCTGCDACVAVCPTNVLDLVENKSRVLRFQDCIQCEACMWACPTTALVMHPEGTEPPPYKGPDIDQHFQTRVPGQYLIGEVAGRPLVKNAANLGRGVIEHMLATGLRGGIPASYGQGDTAVDVVIVGSGPGGLSAGLACLERGLSYVILDKEAIIASTIKRYPKGKLIMAEPYHEKNYSLLPVFDSSKEEIIPIWTELIERVQLNVQLNETVEVVQKRQDGLFEVRSDIARYLTQRVVLATGLRGKPRTLKVTGENQAKVQSLLEDPDDFRGQAVCVVGGGDSALEAAIALADAGAKVVLSYRGRSFSRAQPKNKQLVESYEQQRRIKIKYMSQVVEFGPDTVTLQMSDGTQKRYPNQAAFVLIGADPPIKWLSTLGIDYIERAHMAPGLKASELVSTFMPNARECPPNAVGAAALVLGQSVPPEADVAVPAPHQQPTMHEAAQPADQAKSKGPRKWLRQATQIFRGSGKMEEPMELSEFADRQRHQSRSGRRDSLDAGERTRILRMLRDEGGRKADEESRVIFLADLAKQGRADSAPEPSPPPEPVHNFDLGEESTFIGGHGLNDADSDEFEGEATLALSAEEAMANPSIDLAQPKKAVIVGLARANAEGPRGQRRPDAPAPAVTADAPTHIGSLEEAMAEALGKPPPEAPVLGSEPLGDMTRSEFEFDDKTNLATFDPAELMARADEIERQRAAEASRAAPEMATRIQESPKAPPARAKPAARSVPPPPPPGQRRAPRPAPPAPPAARTQPPPPPGARAAGTPSRPRPAAVVSDRVQIGGARPPSGPADPTMFTADEINDATAAIDLNRMPTDDGVASSSGTTRAIDMGGLAKLESVNKGAAGQRGADPATRQVNLDQSDDTRVETLSDIDWDLD